MSENNQEKSDVKTESPAPLADISALAQSKIDRQPGVTPGFTKNSDVSPDNVARDDAGKIESKADKTPAKKRGRPPGVKNKKNRRQTRVSNISEQEKAAARENEKKAMQQQSEATCQVAGAAAARSFFTINQLISEEMAPIKDEATGQDELAVHAAAWRDYFLSKGVVDIPPGVTLAIVITEYYAVRLQMPKTQKRVGGLWDRAKFWWKEKRKEKAGKLKEKKAEENKHKAPTGPVGVPA